MTQAGGEVSQSLVVGLNLSPFQNWGHRLPAGLDDLEPTWLNRREQSRVGVAGRPAIRRLDGNSGEGKERHVTGLARELETKVGHFLDRQLAGRQRRETPL